MNKESCINCEHLIKEGKLYYYCTATPEGKKIQTHVKPDWCPGFKQKESDVNKYLRSNGQEFMRFPVISWTSIEVLPKLIGKKFDDNALGMMHSLRPSSIRVSDGGVKCDASVWRVTVFVNNKEDLIIEKVEQEVEVGVSSTMENGSDMSNYYG